MESVEVNLAHQVNTSTHVHTQGLRILETRTAQIIQELGFMLDDVPQDVGMMDQQQQQQQHFGATNGYYNGGMNGTTGGMNGINGGGGGW